MVEATDVKSSSSRWQGNVAALLLLMFLCVFSVRAQPATSACTAGACVTAGPRLASVNSTQGPVLNLLFSALLPGTTVNLTVLDWNSLAGANVNLNALLTQLNGGAQVSDPGQVLNAAITVGALRAAMVNVLRADGQTAAANVLGVLPLGVAGAGGTIRLGELLQIALPVGSLSDIRLNVLDLLTGGLQLYNFSNVVTTPQPITVNTAALGLSGLANTRLWLQAVEPPVYACGALGTSFHSAAIRIKLDLELVQGLDVAPLISALTNLNVLGLAQVNVNSLSASVLRLQVYADIARAEGTIAAVNLVGSSVNLQARPGLVNLYVGQISDAVFFNRTRVLDASVLSPVALTSLNLSVRVSAAGLPVADVVVPLTVGLRGYAAATPGLQTASFTGPYPQTRTLSAGTVSAATLVSTLVNSLDVQITSGTPVVTLLGSLALPLPINSLVNSLVSALLPPLRLVTNAVVTPVLTTLLGGVVDNLLGLLGIRIGQAVFTVEGIAQSCAATLQLVKDLQPANDTGRFNLAITYNGSAVGSVSNVGNNGATAAVVTVPGGTYALAESAAAGTTLGRYASSWSCTRQDGTVEGSGTGSSFTLQAPPVSPQPVTLVCRITNRTRQADLSITKSDGRSSYTPGASTVYSIVVSNAGPDAVVAAQVTDALPAGATLSAPWSCSASAGSTCGSASGGAVGGTAVNAELSLLNGGQATISVPVTFSSDPAAY